MSAPNSSNISSYWSYFGSYVDWYNSSKKTQSIVNTEATNQAIGIRTSAIANAQAQRSLAARTVKSVSSKKVDEEQDKLFAFRERFRKEARPY